ncbi:hypothetical protein HYH03_003781 [Edaphochlamys debaryana]|uniref:Uncharacterized protein n=1 Tax=Edaphochlamys debaryana TaxID=47281 RepID=A0A835YCX3_9CHLO|nr:hypothetical protein HYH03_003781 [Edaphochlamys debaryana]|eukprot:KAG2498531.1 hypothetical protein HYH03_003781 [Edaphochlamys debaryana]
MAPRHPTLLLLLGVGLSLAVSASATCCEDCRNLQGDDLVFHCFEQVFRGRGGGAAGHCHNCVSASDCLDLSRSVAGNVAEAACSVARDKCGAAAALAQALQVTRPQCYRAAKNVCLTYARDYAQDGSGSCSGYTGGYGSCDAGTFRSYVDEELESLCDRVGKGIAISLP